MNSEWKAAIFLALALAISGCQTTQSPDLAPDGQPFQVSRPSYFFDSQESHLKQLVDAREFGKAARLYIEQQPYFEVPENRAKARETLAILAAFLLQDTPAKLQAARQKLDGMAVGMDLAVWPEHKANLKNAKDALASYPDHPLLKVQGFGWDNLEPFQARHAALVDGYSRQASAAMDQLGLARLDLFKDTYPVDVDLTPLLAARHAMVDALLATGKLPELKGFARGAKGSLPQATQKKLTDSIFAKIDQEMRDAKRSPLARQLAAMDAMHELGMDPAAMPALTLGFADATSRVLLDKGQIDFAPEIQIDLPAEVKTIASVEGVFAADAPRFSIVVQTLMAKASRDVTSMNPSRSKFLAGYRQEPNPDYKTAVLDMNSAMMKLQQMQLNQATQAPSTNMFGALANLTASMATIAARAKFDEARELVANTPEYRDVPIFEPYAFRVARVKGAKVASVNYFVIDREEGRYFKGVFDVVEQRDFSVAYGIVEEDPDRQKHLASSDSEGTVGSWEKATATVKLSDLIEDYLRRESEWTKGARPEAILKAMSEDASTAIARVKAETPTTRSLDDSRFGHVVVIRSSDGLGTGFYITPDVVMTNWHVVDEQEFVTINKYDGTETFGKVIAKDVRQDLAIVRVQSRGVPATLYSGPDLRPGQEVDAIGHPKGIEYTITRGIISAIRKAPSVNDVGGDPVLFVQMDASINPGNSGGPVFLGEQVIAVSDWGRGDATNLNFAIHISEVRGFLRKYLPEMGS